MSRNPIFTRDKIKDLASRFDVRDLLKSYAYQNKPLDFNRAYTLGIYTLAPYKPELKEIFKEDLESISKRSLAVLCALHNRETYGCHQKNNQLYPAAEQIAGICAAIFDYDLGLSKKGYLKPRVPYAIDNCGMGGDVRVTPNVSTVSALIAAAAGIPICKHGSPSNADKGNHGSSDFIANLALGMRSYEELILIPRRKIEQSVEQFGFGYTEALDTGYKVIHDQTHRYGRLPHMNDIIGPITNPLDTKIATKKILGVNQLIKPIVVAQAYQILNRKGVTDVKDGIFLRGFTYKDRAGPEDDDGMDELSTMPGGTLIARLKDGKIEEYNLYARDFGLSDSSYEDIRPPRDRNGNYQKGQFSYKILKNEELGPARDMILVNAALIEHLARGTDLKQAYKKMKEVLDSGEPYENLQRIKSFLMY